MPIIFLKELVNLNVNLDTDKTVKFAESNISITEDGEPRFNTSNYELDRPLLKVKNKKVIILMKDKLDGKIIVNLLD